MCDRIYYKMLQHWVSKGNFYIGGSVLLNLIEPVTLAHCTLMSLN